MVLYHNKTTGELLTVRMIKDNAKRAVQIMPEKYTEESYYNKVVENSNQCSEMEYIEGYGMHSVLCSHARSDDCDCKCKGKFHKNSGGKQPLSEGVK